MPDYATVDNYLGIPATPEIANAFERIYWREHDKATTAPVAKGRDFETVAAALYRPRCPPPPDNVDAAWCRIVARERARMGLPDPSLVRSAAIGYLMEFGGSMGALELVDLGAYANLATAHVMLRDLAAQGRIRRVGRGVYALPVAS